MITTQVQLILPLSYLWQHCFHSLKSFNFVFRHVTIFMLCHRAEYNVPSSPKEVLLFTLSCLREEMHLHQVLTADLILNKEETNEAKYCLNVTLKRCSSLLRSEVSSKHCINVVLCVAQTISCQQTRLKTQLRFDKTSPDLS